MSEETDWKAAYRELTDAITVFVTEDEGGEATPNFYRARDRVKEVIRKYFFKDAFKEVK